MTDSILMAALWAAFAVTLVESHSHNVSLEMWRLFDDLRWQCEFSLAEDAARAENKLNYLKFYRR